MDFLLLGLEQTLNIKTILIIALSVLFGIIFGAMPGLTATLGIILLLPFTFALGPINGIAALIGMYVGATSGGLISATLIGIPGTGASIVTTFDGYPMAQKGKPNTALSLGVFASVIGGIVSMILLTFISPLLAKLALLFGPWEYFALGIFGLTIVVSVSAKDMTKGLIGASMGIIITLIGQDPIFATPRFTFGFEQLRIGFDLLPTLLGLFAISLFFKEIYSSNTGDVNETRIILDEKYKIFPKFNLIKKSFLNLIRSSFIGTLIGILPGAGGSIASFISYDQAKKASKEPEKFGKGSSEGIIASEAANNGVTGGALIPLITLGIPGDMVTAVILGGLLIHGLQPGPMLFINNADVVGTIFVGLLFATVLMFFIQSSLMRFFTKIILIPKYILLPLIIIMSVAGTFSANNRIFDLYVLIIFGFIGYILIKNNFDLAPIILGYILGPIIEKNFRSSLMATSGDLLPFITRPVSLIFLILTLLSILYPIYKSQKNKKENFK